MWEALPSFKGLKIESGVVKQVQMIKSFLVLERPHIDQDQTGQVLF